jgi:hypothetical protein
MERDDETEDEPRRGYFRAQGYAWYAYPTSADAPWNPVPPHDPNSTTNKHVNYMGPISDSEGLVNELRDGGYLFITSEELYPKVLEGWAVEPAELGSDFEAHDMGTIRMVREIRPRDPEFEPFHQYEIEGWE